MNHQEPSGTSLSRSKADKLPTCPYNLIRKIYHDVLPELPRATLGDAKGRREATATFWAWVLTSSKDDGSKRAATADEAILWITKYFARARGNDFLMGRTNRGEKNSTWRCGFDFLLTDKGKVQVIEKTEAPA